MPTTILDGETYEQALARRMAEEAAFDAQLAMKEHTMPTPTRTITIPAREDHDGHAAMTITVPWVCLQCGGPRGEPHQAISYDGSRGLTVDVWTNPCGHVEKYSKVRAALAYQEQPPTNPYLIALAQVQLHHGTSGQAALAKAILSLYNDVYSFAMGEILAPLDTHYTRIVLDIMTEYAHHGETAELRQAGEWCYQNFPRLREQAVAMHEARSALREQWAREREEENRRLYPEEYR